MDNVLLDIWRITNPTDRYSHIEDSFSMNQECWTAAHVNTFRYIGGVTRTLQCDNLKTSPKKHDHNEVTLKKFYHELAEY